MDAATDTDKVGGSKISAANKKPNKGRSRISNKMETKIKTSKDTVAETLSAPPEPDVQGQLYLFDTSEEPNVSMRLSNLEEFIYKLLTDKAGVGENTYLAILAHFSPLVSQRFKKDVLSNVSKDGDAYHLTPPKFTGPAAAEIWS